MKKQLIIQKAINDLEEFFLTDMPSKIFPMERLQDKTWFREDFFETKRQVGKYISEHFKILNKEIKRIMKVKLNSSYKKAKESIKKIRRRN